MTVDSAINLDNSSRGAAQVGEAWMDSGLERSELFLTTKLSVDSFGTMEAAVQLEYQLDALQTEYVARHTAMQKLRIVILRFGTARQKRVLE
jgi:diketogulonate reductase-like aldo/keto reductase